MTFQHYIPTYRMINHIKHKMCDIFYFQGQEIQNKISVIIYGIAKWCKYFKFDINSLKRAVEYLIEYLIE